MCNSWPNDITIGYLENIVLQKSANDKGTLYQLKHLIHQMSVKNNPKHCTKAAEDFYSLYFMHILPLLLLLLQRSAVNRRELLIVSAVQKGLSQVYKHNSSIKTCSFRNQRYGTYTIMLPICLL